MRRVQTGQSSFSAFVSCLVDVQGCVCLKPARFGSDTYFVWPGRSAEPHGAFDPPGASPGAATCELGLLGACKKDGDRLPSRARWGRTRGDGLTLKEGQGEIFLQ